MTATPGLQALSGSTLAGVAVSVFAVLAFVALGYRAFLRFYDDARSAVLGERFVAYPAQPGRKLLLRCLSTTLLLRLAFFCLAYLLGVVFRQQPVNPFSAIANMLSRWDGPHYLEIARYGYGTEGELAYNIVFFPLFPWLVRGVMLLTGDAFWAAQIVNWACSAGACYLLYRLAEPTMGNAAWKSVIWFLLFPTAFYLMLPYSEALFIALTLACFLMLQRNRFLPAALLGGLAAMTRNVGVLLALPYALTAVLAWVGERRPARGYTPLRSGATVRLWARLSGVLLIGCGTLVYLLVNKLVFGNAWVFLETQRNHWQQGFGWFFNTAAMIVRYTFFSDVTQTLYLWLPQLVIMVFSYVVLYRCRARSSSAQLVFAFVYFFFVLSATWLLSGARYMLALFPLFIMLARSVPKAKTWQLAVPMAAAQMFLAIAHMFGQYVF